MKTHALAWNVVLILALAISALGFISQSANALPSGAISLAAPYLQDFNILAVTGTSNAWMDDGTLPGWYATKQYNLPLNTYRADNGASNTGAIYSFGAAGETERAFGSISSGTPGNHYYGVRLVNDTGNDLPGIFVRYTGEQWRNGGNTTQHRLDFSYRTGAGLTNLTDGTWTDVNALDFIGPIATATSGALNGNDPANQALVTGMINVSIPDGDEIMLRWFDPNDAGNDHGLALDNLAIGTDAPPEITSTIPANNTPGGVAVDAEIVILFNELVNVTGDWFLIDCVSSGVHTAVLQETLPSDTLTLVPDDPFTDGEYCTVTLVAAGITDDDANDPPDNMLQNFDFTFGVGDTPPSLTSISPINGSINVMLDTLIVTTFNEPITTVDGWYTLTCSVSGNPEAVLVEALPSATLTLDLTDNLNFGDVCNFVIDPSKIYDVDGDSDPLSVGYNGEFSTITTGPGTVRIRDIQGAGHISPYATQLVANVPGIVTAIRPGNGFFIQDDLPDTDDATSEGIYVYTGSTPSLMLGDYVLVSGRISEYRSGSRPHDLTLTEFSNTPTWTRVTQGNSLPLPVVIGSGGRIPPTTIIEDDATNVEVDGIFDPDNDGIDFFESLEGMRVQVNDAVTVGGANSFNELAVVGDNGANAGAFTLAGGLIISPADFNPERIILDDSILPIPQVAAGTQFTSPLVGVMDYAFSNFKFYVTETFSLTEAPLINETAQPGDAGLLTVASYNVENLDPSDGTRFDVLAGHIVNNLLAPDIIGLQEIQDNTGEANDGVVAADVTLNMLITAIANVGGPAYEFRQVNPQDNLDGGAPGANIRVAFLYNPARVSFIDRGAAGATDATIPQLVAGQVELTLNPGRIAPTNTAFSDSRKPLAGEFEFQGRKVFVVTNHFNSKGGDDALFGIIQPPVLSSEAQRLQQAALVNSFVDSILALDARADVVVLGDLNDFPFSNPLHTLEGEGLDQVLTNLHHKLPETERYTYIYDGNSQALDHILVSPDFTALSARASFDIVHVNANNPDTARVSDHDPLLATLYLPDQWVIVNPVTDTQAGDPGQTVTYTLTVTNLGVVTDTFEPVITDPASH